MLNKNIKWNKSETKKIYNANKHSEQLMEYLEFKLFKDKLADSCADSPNYERGYGVMIYYKNGRRVLTSAPRKREQHIHVVLPNSNINELKQLKIPLGRGGNDVLLSNETQIDVLIEFLKGANSPEFDREESILKGNLSLEEWLKLFYQDKENLGKIDALIKEREKFIQEFEELDELKNNKISISEFKKRLDQKAKKRFDFNGIKINKWGFSGPSGQMFFNQLHNQAKYLDLLEEFTALFLETINIPNHEEGDFSWTKEKFEKFGAFVKETKKKAIAMGYPPQKCASINRMTFFISFFWGIQGLKKYPMFYKASRDGLRYLGYSNLEDKNATIGNRYLNFVKNLQALQSDLLPYLNKLGIKQTMDMHFIGHFLYFIKHKIEDEIVPSEPELDPFALSIRDVLYENGYKMSEIVSEDANTMDFDEKYYDKLIWHYINQNEEDDVLGLYIVWEDEETYDADVFIEDNEGQFISHEQIIADSDKLFLNEFRNYLKNLNVSKQPYTVEDVSKDTYIDKELLEEWLDLLTEQKQIILYGPPGTGKTYLAERLAKVLTQNSKLVHLIQFHPSYTYEEFIEGMKPELVQIDGSQQISINIEPGIFTKLCDEARKPENQNKSYVLIIDEINRANTAKVFGELLYALEYRNNPIKRPYSKKMLVVPENVYIIGTMNTTDRSLAKLDFALRRRFQFVPFTAEATANILERYLMEHHSEMLYVARLVRKVNDLINDPDISIGHSYFMGKDLTIEKVRKIWKYQIYPFLEECFVHDPEKLAQFDLQTLLDMDDLYE
jgi:5-methylcytosine-specific restriction enzyme B